MSRSSAANFKKKKKKMNNHTPGTKSSFTEIEELKIQERQIVKLVGLKAFTHFDLLIHPFIEEEMRHTYAIVSGTQYFKGEKQR